MFVPLKDTTSDNKLVNLFLPKFVLLEIQNHSDDILGTISVPDDEICKHFCVHSSKCKVCSATKRSNSDEVAKRVFWHEQVVKSGKFNFESCKYVVNKKVNVEFMEHMLCGYTDKSVCKFLQFGFPISFLGDISNFESKEKWKYRNHKGAEDFPDQLNAYLSKEIDNGSVIGPFKDNPFSTPVIVSPLNTVPKKDTDERRVILDLSFPRGNSVNDFVKKDEYLHEMVELIFPRVDDFINLVKVKGKGALMFKKDLKKAYRQIPIDPGDYHLVSYIWKKHLFCDTVLSMGLRNAAYICQRVTNAIAFIMLQIGIAILNYLDDLAGVENKSNAHFAYYCLGEVLAKCGLVESVDKASPPSEIMVFLGVLFNTITMTVEVTPDRLIEIK